jgi:hypothetical protein
MTLKNSIDLDRRKFLKTAGVLALGQLVPTDIESASAAEATANSRRPAKPPYRVIFSNDSTNVISCTSPYHKRGEDWRPEMLEASVDEVAGKVDAHFIQLASGQVPWYRSDLYPMAEHMAWWQEHFKADPWHDALSVAPVHKFILDGGDVLQVFINRCRKTGQAPFVSMRMNDGHLLEYVNKTGNTLGIHCISRFYAEHLQWRIGTDSSWDARVLNWGVPEVPDHIFSLAAEQCRKYDIDGFEMDFTRHTSYFRLNETTVDQRRAIMTNLVRRVRKVLDESSREGKHRWLCARVPCYVSSFDALGIDLPAWAGAGLDMVNLSPYFFTVQQTDLPIVRKTVPEVAVYQEMCHCTWNGPQPPGSYDSSVFRRTTTEQFESTAHWAYARGGDGVTLFNFVYFREYGFFSGDRGPFSEPPFAVLKHLGDPEYLARQSQVWFAAPGWKCPFGGVAVQLPQKVLRGKNLAFAMDLAPPEGNWRKDGRLRMQSSADLRGSRWTARLNDQTLVETTQRSEPYPDPYPPLLGRPYEMRAWTVPAQLVRAGSNQVEFELLQGNEMLQDKSGYEIVFSDLAMPVSAELDTWHSSGELAPWPT